MQNIIVHPERLQNITVYLIRQHNSTVHMYRQVYVWKLNADVLAGRLMVPSPGISEVLSLGHKYLVIYPAKVRLVFLRVPLFLEQ
jgi:hypothetical protein